MVIDLLLVISAYSISYILKFLYFTKGTEHLTYSEYMGYMVYILVGYLVIFSWSGLYGSYSRKSRIKQIFTIVQANLIGVFYILALLYLLKEVDISRSFLAIFAVLNTFEDLLVRRISTSVLRSVGQKEKNLKDVLIVGYSRTCENFIDRVNSNPEWGFGLKGILDDSMEIGTRYRSISVIGKIDELDDYLADSDLYEVVITLRIDDYDHLADIVNACEKAGVHTRFCPDFKNVISSDPEIEDMDGLPVINIRKVPLTSFFNRVLKRTEDIVGGIAALIVFAIPMIVTAILVKATSKGPVIYKQTRVGRHNREFMMYKFRSMRVQDEEEEKTEWTKEGDDRVTPIGHFIRRTSIDELPQIFNVIKGDMSLVGPRPERPQFVEQFKEEIPRYMVKHQVRPGMTGWAQVNGYRGNTSIRKRIDYDLYYIENWTVGLDVKILFMTVFKGFINKNAY